MICVLFEASEVLYRSKQEASEQLASMQPMDPIRS